MLFMVRCGATDNVGGALRAAIFLGDKTSRVAAGTAPPTFAEWVESNPGPSGRATENPWLVFQPDRIDEFSRIEGIETGGTD